MHSSVFTQNVISGKSLALTEYEAAIASSEDVTPTHFSKKRRNFLSGWFNKNSPKTTSDISTTSKSVKKPFSHKFNIMQRIRNASAKKSSKLTNKRHTPEGAILSVSETSLLDIEPSSDEQADTLKTDHNDEPPTSNQTSSIQPQPRKVLQNEIQSNNAKEEEAIQEKSENLLLKTFDTTYTTSSSLSSSTDAIRRQSNVDTYCAGQPMKSTPPPRPPHSTSEVSITKVSVAPVICDMHQAQPQGNNQGALQTVITTTSHLQQTRRRQVKTKSLPTNSSEEYVNRCAKDHNDSVVLNSDKKDEDPHHHHRSSVYKSEEFSSKKDNQQESEKKIHFQLDTKESTIMSALASEKREHLYKILVIGELGTGKTSFIKRYVHQFFSQNYRATIGVDFALKVLNWDQNTIIRLQLWDIAGQERFGNMTRVYYKEAVGAFIVFDVTRSATFDAVVKWKQDLDSKVQLPNGSPIPCILLANKCDQPKQGLINQAQKMDEYVKQNGFAGWFETSAKENVNIEEAARALVNNILLNDKMINADEIIDADKFGLATEVRPKKNCAC